MVVAFLLAAIWAAVLVPPAVHSHKARQAAFEVGLGRLPAPAPAPASAASTLHHSPAVQRRRRIAGGLLMATLATGLAGLLPAFRVLLVVHLFVVDSFLFYVALLARRADRRVMAAWGGAAHRQLDREPIGSSPRRAMSRASIVAEVPVAPAR